MDSPGHSRQGAILKVFYRSYRLQRPKASQRKCFTGTEKEKLPGPLSNGFVSFVIMNSKYFIISYLGYHVA